MTILATALIDTGSRMDEVIFEEFKGIGNPPALIAPSASYRFGVMNYCARRSLEKEDGM